MLRALKLLILTVILVGIVILSVANRGIVTLKLLPPEAEDILPLSIELPMFVVIIAAVLVGLLLGYVIEYLREAKHRRRAAQQTREAARLAQENQTLKKKTLSDEDEVLALLN